MVVAAAVAVAVAVVGAVHDDGGANDAVGGAPRRAMRSVGGGGDRAVGMTAARGLGLIELLEHQSE